MCKQIFCLQHSATTSYRSTSQEEGTWGQYGDRRSVPELVGVKGFTFPSFALIPRVLI